MLGVLTKPVEDGEPADPTETLTELYFQLRGYITATNKWFWIWEDGKKQRGYQDIDLIAVNGSETVLVSVTQNLDGKIRAPSTDHADISKVVDYFERVKAYLRAVPEYNWLLDRRVRMVLVYGYGSPGKDLQMALYSAGVELSSMDDILKFLMDTMRSSDHRNRRVTNRVIRLLQELERKSMLGRCSE